MLALGWTLFFALYFIGLVWALVLDMVSHRGGIVPWRWRWILLGWPFLLLSDAWDSRQAVMDVLTGKRARL